MNSERFREIFFEIFNQYVSDNDKIEKMYADVVKRYSAKNRYYHNLNHIYKMCDLWEKNKEKFKLPNLIFIAIVYHDIIYNVKKRMMSSEMLSAYYFFEKVAKKNWFNLNAGYISYVMEVINCTQHIGQNKDSQTRLFNDGISIFLDIDLSILSSEENDYKQYANDIRKEYKCYSNFIYKKGRLDVLNHLLDKEKIYLSKEFSKFEKIARNNIQNEIIYLSSSKKRK